jgi:anaphase-promoting complex subunit 1
VHIVEAMHGAGMTPRVLETLPEALLAPMQDAIAMCQAKPPSSWSRELLELVNRGDISLILEPGRRPRQSAANLLVS